MSQLLDKEQAFWIAKRVAAHIMGTQHAPVGSLERLLGDEIKREMGESEKLVKYIRANEWKS